MRTRIPDLKELRVCQRPRSSSGVDEKPPRHRRGERFLKGPIPLIWLGAAAILPGRALAVALELWFWAGLKNKRVVRISLSHLRSAPGMSRSSASRGLGALERAGLVSVVRKPGRKPIITLTDASGSLKWCDQEAGA